MFGEISPMKMDFSVSIFREQKIYYAFYDRRKS